MDFRSMQEENLSRCTGCCNVRDEGELNAQNSSYEQDIKRTIKSEGLAKHYSQTRESNKVWQLDDVATATKPI